MLKREAASSCPLPQVLFAVQRPLIHLMTQRLMHLLTGKMEKPVGAAERM